MLLSRTTGVTLCPTRYVLSTTGCLSMAEAARCLAEMKVRRSGSYAWLAAAQRIFMTWVGRR
jgi:hypothetical protein